MDFHNRRKHHRRWFNAVTFFACLFVGAPLLLHAQQAKLDLTQPYLVLATSKTSTMQKELDQAAFAGYRVLMGARTASGEIGLLLEKSQTPEVYAYKLLATSRTSTMQKELDQTALQGFRILPRTLMGGKSEIVVILEKPPGTRLSTQYKLIATSLTGTLQTEMKQATRDGFEVVSVVSRNEHMVILEKTSQPAPRPSGVAERYVLLATEKTSSMQKELEQNARIGYRLLAGSSTSGSEIAMFMEKMEQPTTLFEYKLLATNRASTMQNELNVAAFEGYRLLRKPVAGKRGATGGFFGRVLREAASPTGVGLPGLTADETVAVMERSSGSTDRYEYLVLDTGRTSTMQTEISTAVRNGYELAAMMGSPSSNLPAPVLANLIVVMERPALRPTP